MTVPLVGLAGAVGAGASPLLEHLAGDLAAVTAAVWPQPHADFLAASAARRHLAWLALARDEPVRAAAVLQLPLGQAIEAQFDRAPAGLRRALGRLGETAWAADDYRILWGQLHRPTAAKVLRHLEVIAPRDVRLLMALPRPLHRGPVLEFLTLDDGILALHALGAIARRDGGAAPDLAARRWACARDRDGFLDLIGEDLVGEPMDPGLRPSRELVWLGSRAALRDAARRYRNCLTDFGWETAEGGCAFFEWTHGSGAIVRLQRDPVFGWSLVQALGPQNTAVPAALRPALIEALGRMGVHVGVRLAELRAALDWGGAGAWDQGRLFGGG